MRILLRCRSIVVRRPRRSSPASFALPYVDALAFIARAAGMAGHGRTDRRRGARRRSSPSRSGRFRRGTARSTRASIGRPSGDVAARGHAGAGRAHGRHPRSAAGRHGRRSRGQRLHGADRRHAGPAALPDHAAIHRHHRGRRQVARRPGERPDGSDGKIGMLGISFSGGLSIVAAGRPELRDKVELRHVVRRPRRSAARDAVSLLGQRAGDAAARRGDRGRRRRRARDDQAAARLRRRRRAAQRSPTASCPPIRSSRCGRAS